LRNTLTRSEPPGTSFKDAYTGFPNSVSTRGLTKLTSYRVDESRYVATK
jgi:hypothetical protein